MAGFAKWVALFALVVVLGLAAPNARATTMEYDFAGTCTDCSGVAHAKLFLNGYTPGASIEKAEFVRFDYAGTNLLPAYTITAADLTALSGALPSRPSHAEIYVASSSELFFSGIGGAWCTGAACQRDQGTAGIFSVSSRAIPEPISFAMLAPAIAGLGVLRRRLT